MIFSSLWAWSNSTNKQGYFIDCRCFFCREWWWPIDLPKVSLKKLRTLDTKRSFAIIASAFIYGWMISSNIWRARHLKKPRSQLFIAWFKGYVFCRVGSIQNPFNNNLEHEWCRSFLVKSRHLLKSWKGWSKYNGILSRPSMFHFRKRIRLARKKSPAFTGHCRE